MVLRSNQLVIVHLWDCRDYYHSKISLGLVHAYTTCGCATDCSFVELTKIFADPPLQYIVIPGGWAKAAAAIVGEIIDNNKLDQALGSFWTGENGAAAFEAVDDEIGENFDPEDKFTSDWELTKPPELAALHADNFDDLGQLD